MALVWIIVTALSINEALGQQQHRCHVCLSETGSDVEVDRVFPGAKLESCHRSSDIMVCPDNYKGCLTQSKGDQVMRTCAQLAVDACRWANGVEYCYCMGDLCNAPPARPEPPPDDEDNLEGSGSEPPVTTDQEPPTTPEPSVVTSPPSPPSSGAVRARLALSGLICVLVAVWR